MDFRFRASFSDDVDEEEEEEEEDVADKVVAFKRILKLILEEFVPRAFVFISEVPFSYFAMSVETN